jgi:replicative DNA helicase
MINYNRNKLKRQYLKLKIIFINSKMEQFKINKRRILIEKYLPHNFLGEKMILSCLLINSEAIELTLRTLSIEAFYFKNHQEIYKALIFMYRNKLPIDILTLTTFLQENGLLQKVGGVKVLLELIYQIPNLVYLEEYIRLVKDKFLRRALIKLGYQTINSGYITNISLENILNDLENELFTLTNEIKIQKVCNSAQLLNTIFSELK